jgi:hypothetical protein
MKTLSVVLAVAICLAVGFASGFKTALVCEHNRLEHNKRIISRMLKEVWSNPDTNSELKVTEEPILN